MMSWLRSALLALWMFYSSGLGAQSKDLILLTVATNNTDGFQRYLRSVTVNHLDGKVLGMGEKWLGGDMNYPGGGFKVNLLKKELLTLKETQPEAVVLFTDSYDVIVQAGATQILDTFEREFSGSRVVFGAEGFCWPLQNLASKYPEVATGYRYLNSGGFIGYAADLYDFIDSKPLKDDEDDQLFYTQLYLDEELRGKYKIRLDHGAQIFQNLNGNVGDVKLQFDDGEPMLTNEDLGSTPLVIHGNGPSKRVLNSLGNYLAKAWNSDDQCTACWEDNISFEDLPEVPQVVLGIFVESPTPFLTEFLEKITQLEYPKDKIDLFIHNAAEYHTANIDAFIADAENFDVSYNSIKLVGASEGMNEWDARNAGIQRCLEVKCDYYFSVDSIAHLDNPHTLTLLIEQNRRVIAPMLVRPYKAWSNFWGALTSEGFYARSTDYMELVQNNRRGLWNVPFISGAYLVQGKLIHDDETRPSFVHHDLDADMAFCANLREKDVFFYVSNRIDWGHLINADDFDTSHTSNELWEITNNRYDWERRYLHPNYSLSLEEGAKIAQPCPDVYWFPMVTERWADELIAEMENYGKWSDGTNQIGYESHWLQFLDTYIRPLQESVFIGYTHSPPRAIMNFVVRYRPDEQPLLRPHHDSSTYTINIALNHAGTDFQGGGCNFIRYNCSVPDTKKGWMLMHPGRLTHYHEGLRVTGGTRYIMVSFVDP